jgi:hypothetical protein
MLREQVKLAQEALDECYGALDDEDLPTDVRDLIYDTLYEAEQAYETVLRELARD